MQVSLVNYQKGSIPIDNRGLAYGDGLFETIKIENSRVQFLTEHLDRLSTGAQRLNIPFTVYDRSVLEEYIQVHFGSLSETHVLKIIVVRNYIGRGYAFDDKCQSIDVIIQLDPYNAPSWVAEGVKLITAKPHINLNPSLAGIKHLNRLDSVLARSSVPKIEADEVLLTSHDGDFFEGSMSNVFFELGGEWVTPELTNAGVTGIIRQKVLGSFESFKVKKIKSASGVDVVSGFICNSLIGVVPINILNGRQLNRSKIVTELNKEIFSTC
jgi:4-amino-4-deoxychorismate lyase